MKSLERKATGGPCGPVKIPCISLGLKFTTVKHGLTLAAFSQTGLTQEGEINPVIRADGLSLIETTPR